MKHPTFIPDLCIPVALPRLPRAERLLPYLQEIDARRTYSNHGPLVRRLEMQLSSHFGAPPGSVVTVANATLGLTLALQALGARRNSLCLVPGWTFAATAHAVTMAGLRPYFVDVDPQSWALTPEIALQAMARAPGRVGAVMPVAPFGAPIDLGPWERFSEQTCLPVVIDAAAAFDTARAGNVPCVVSLHATKALGAGEGGLVLSRDACLLSEVQRRANFGFSGSREARVIATNAKMSEYHAAVALAALEEWPVIRAALERVALGYRQALEGTPNMELQSGYGRWVSATCLVRLAPGLEIEEVTALLEAAGIATRRWWPRILPEERAFAACARDPLPAASQLAATVLGLPCFTELGTAQIGHVARALAQLQPVEMPGILPSLPALLSGLDQPGLPAL